MPGVPGTGGPPPKRDSQRRRRTEPAKGPAVRSPGKAAKPLAPDEGWHPAARLWFDSLASSGQAVFYQASDWASAWVVAESISRELNPQPIVVAGADGEAAQVEMHSLPPKGASLSAWLKAFTALMATEGDRRRLRLELERPDAPAVKERAGVSDLDRYRDRLRSPAG